MPCLSRSRQESSLLAKGWVRVRRVLVLKQTLHMFELKAADIAKHRLEVWLLQTRVRFESLCITFFCIDCMVLLVFLEQTVRMVWRKMDWGRDYGLPTNAFCSKQLPRKNANVMIESDRTYDAAYRRPIQADIQITSNGKGGFTLSWSWRSWTWRRLCGLHWQRGQGVATLLFSKKSLVFTGFWNSKWMQMIPRWGNKLGPESWAIPFKAVSCWFA